MFAERSLEKLAHPFDRLRQKLLETFGAFLVPFIRSRALRVNTVAIIGFSIAAILSLQLPLWQLTLGPIIWGIPHIIGDLRYLVIKQGLIRSLSFWLFVVIPLAYFTYQPRITTTMIAVGGGALLGAIYQRSIHLQKKLSTTTKQRLFIVFTLVSIGYLLAQQLPRQSHFALLHGHNLITLAIWWFWRPRRRWEWISIGVLIGFSVLILLGWEADEWRNSYPKEVAFGKLSMSYFEVTLAGIIPREWRPQLVVLYGFLQSAHYLVWVRLIPEDDRLNQTPITFRRSVIRLSQDFGSWILLFTLLAMIGLGAWAMIDVASARFSYLRWISAHASLELVLIAYLFVSHQPLRTTSKC